MERQNHLWFVVAWKYMTISNWIISPSRGENKNSWNHHPNNCVKTITWNQKLPRCELTLSLTKCHDTNSNFTQKIQKNPQIHVHLGPSPPKKNWSHLMTTVQSPRSSPIFPLKHLATPEPGTSWQLFFNAMDGWMDVFSYGEIVTSEFKSSISIPSYT